jgi:hypothetical protein
MKKYINFRSFLPHLLVVVGFAVLSVSYMSPILNGKELRQSDPRQFIAAQQELRTYAKETGEWTGWTNGIFGGMPTYFIGGDYSKSIFYEMQGFIYRLLSTQGTYIFLYLLGAYILLISLQAGIWPSILGAIGYAFFSYNILIIEAGHLAKIYALAFVPLMLGGLALAFRNRPWLGAALFSLGVGLELNANHFQITYYSAFILATFGIFEIVQAFKEKRIDKFALGAGLCLVMGLTAAATNTSRIWTSTDHAKETNRGGTELVSTDPTNVNKADGGLDKEYAYNWSYGKLESFTLLIPNFSGGASGGGALDDDSEVYKTLNRIGVDKANATQFTQSLPTYWGDQTFSGGPSYAGAVICFLFVLGLFFATKRYRWPYLIAGLICMIISWGGNFRIVNDLFFDYLPMFNKFRSLSMIMALTQLCFVVIAALGLKGILDHKPTWNNFKQPLAISVGVTAGLSLVFALIPSIFDMTTANDEALKGSLSQAFGENQTAANDVYQSLLDDRASLLQADAWRSIIFILLSAGLLWTFVTDKLKSVAVVGGILVFLTLIDLWAIDKRYLNNDDFERKARSLDALFTMSAADQQIMQDKDPHFRVIDLVSGNPFQSSLTSYFHKSVGGYHTVKLGRYNELIENQISKNNMQVLNMLNTKYFISQGTNGQPQAQLNPDALGNAWTVSEVKMVSNANEEMAALDSLNPATTAVVDIRFSKYLENVKPSSDSTNKIQLTEYKPNKLTYEFNSPNKEVVVFSENYYKGNEDWISSIDGKEAPHFRANYVLRAMIIPTGKHTIEFVFKPITVEKGRKIDFGASIAWVLFAVGAIFMDFRNRKEEDAA